MPDEVQQHEKEAPRSIQAATGLVLGLLTLFLVFALIIGLLFSPNQKSPVLAVVVGLILLLICFWVLEKCFRLLTGCKNRGGLMSPQTLRVLSVFFLVLPVFGLFTGYYRETGLAAVFQAVMYFFAFLGLRQLAHERDISQSK